jgi:hypothetical protein
MVMKVHRIALDPVRQGNLTLAYPQNTPAGSVYRRRRGAPIRTRFRSCSLLNINYLGFAKEFWFEKDNHYHSTNRNLIRSSAGGMKTPLIIGCFYKGYFSDTRLKFRGIGSICYLSVGTVPKVNTLLKRFNSRLFRLFPILFL